MPARRREHRAQSNINLSAGIEVSGSDGHGAVRTLNRPASLNRKGTNSVPILAPLRRGQAICAGRARQGSARVLLSLYTRDGAPRHCFQPKCHCVRTLTGAAQTYQTSAVGFPASSASPPQQRHRVNARARHLHARRCARPRSRRAARAMSRRRASSRSRLHASRALTWAGEPEASVPKEQLHLRGGGAQRAPAGRQRPQLRLRAEAQPDQDDDRSEQRQSRAVYSCPRSNVASRPCLGCNPRGPPPCWALDSLTWLQAAELGYRQSYFQQPVLD
jgi:hypothetical protein